MQTRSKNQETLPFEDEIDKRFRQVRKFCQEKIEVDRMAEEEEHKSLRD